MPPSGSSCTSIKGTFINTCNAHYGVWAPNALYSSEAREVAAIEHSVGFFVWSLTMFLCCSKPVIWIKAQDYQAALAYHCSDALHLIYNFIFPFCIFSYRLFSSSLSSANHISSLPIQTTLKSLFTLYSAVLLYLIFTTHTLKAQNCSIK